MADLRVKVLVQVTNLKTGKGYELAESEDVVLGERTRAATVNGLLEKIITGPIPDEVREIELGN